MLSNIKTRILSELRKFDKNASCEFSEHCDFTSTLAFKLAKKQNKNPANIAEEIVHKISYDLKDAVKVKAVKRDGIVYAELAEVPEHVKFLMAKDKKRHTAKAETPKHAHKAKETAEEKVETDEKEKATQEAGVKANKAANKSAKHTTAVKHEKKTQPVRKVLK